MKWTMPETSPTPANPVLVEITRAGYVECIHRGAIALSDADGNPRAALGDIKRPVFPRSAIKLIQALPLVQSGAAARFGFGVAELALASASHVGSPTHVHVAEDMLKASGCAERDLACGPHLPLGENEAREMLQQGRAPHRCHNNCSGKHAGMLATAVHLGEPIAKYYDPAHPVQQRIKAALERLTGATLGETEIGIDGCSAPNWAVPLEKLATAFARLVSGNGLPDDDRSATRTLLEACWQKPELVAGNGQLDTSLLRRFPKKLFVKSGAEGVHCGGLPDSGIGFALKIDDGAKRASQVVASALIAALLSDASDLAKPSPLRNWDGRVVGEIRASGELAAFCAQLPSANTG
jgi:L-asparaginase II